MALPPRERVLTALNHQEPDRVPFAFGLGLTPEARAALDEYLRAWGADYALLAKAAADVRAVGPRYAGPALAPGTDLWGIRRKPVSYGAGTYHEFEYHPLAGVETVEAMDRYPWPRVEYWDFTGLAEAVREVGENGKYALRAGSCNPFEIFTWMTGLEESLIKLVELPEVVRAGLHHITEYFCAFVRRLLEAADGGIDLVFTADDLGAQNGPLLSRQTYREVIMPFHVRLHQTIHEYGARTLYHSDGSVADLLDDLIEAGVDVLEAVQVDAAGMDPVTLKSRFGDRVCFHGGVSVQQVLPHKTADEVRQNVAYLKRVLGRGGGYICAPTHAIQVGTPPANVIAMVEEAVEKPLAAILADAGL